MDRFQKLYSDFKSERFGWRMVLLARKLMLVSTTVMFNQLPLFQVGGVGCSLWCPPPTHPPTPQHTQPPWTSLCPYRKQAAPE